MAKKAHPDLLSGNLRVGKTLFALEKVYNKKPLNQPRFPPKRQGNTRELPTAPVGFCRVDPQGPEG